MMIIKITYILISLASIKSEHTFPNNPIANLSTIWINNDDSNNFALKDFVMRGILVRPIPTPNLAYACGFLKIVSSDHSLFSVSILKIKDSPTSDFEHIKTVWSANKNKPVSTNATFQLSPDGNMILKDAGGEVIWSSNTTGMSVKGLNLTESGNLVLFDANNNVVWQSIDHTTDSLLPEYRFKPRSSEGLYSYPMVCGLNGQCSCPQSANSSVSYFRQVDIRQQNLGCTLITPLDCNASHLHSFVEVLHATYITFGRHVINVDMNTCKKTCLSNCSCKGAYFRHWLNSSIGDGECYLTSQIQTRLVINDDISENYNLTSYLKVQMAPKKAVSKKTYVPMFIGLTFGVLLAVGGIVSAFIMIMVWMKMHDGDEDDLDSLPIVLARFSFKDLKIATWNFKIKLGKGGFGSVYLGSFKDGTKVAVKYIDGIDDIENSFLTEVRSIGSIHHVNLVKLVGYCADKSRRLLVYEYMANGSLDKWLDYGRQEFPLDWNQRKNIVIGIAKGLAYLHEDCRQKIIHLDIKPSNILLDENFNAKLSDFGLSKLLSRDQSKIFTTMKGTPGYLAPEWLSSGITEKVDVYSFGVVSVEIICGRKVVDVSQHEDQIHLLSIFQRKAKEMKLFDMVDEFCRDMKSNRTEVIKMMHIAAWCLQNDFSVRPSMSFVVKVLEGTVNVDLTHLNYNFISPTIFEASRPEGR